MNTHLGLFYQIPNKISVCLKRVCLKRHLGRCDVGICLRSMRVAVSLTAIHKICFID